MLLGELPGAATSAQVIVSSVFSPGPFVCLLLAGGFALGGLFRTCSTPGIPYRGAVRRGVSGLSREGRLHGS